MTSDAIASWGLALGTTTISAIVAAAVPYGGNDIDILLCATVGAVSAILMFGAVLGTWYVLLRHLTGTRRIVSTLVTYLLAGSILGLLLELFFTQIDSAAGDPLEYLSRSVANSTRMMIVLSIGTYIVAVSREHRAQVAVLKANLASTELVVAQAQEAAVAGLQQVLDRVQHELDDQLSAIDAHDLRSVIHDTEHLATEVVRPLSHTLADEIPQIDDPGLEPEAFESGWNEFWRNVRVGPHVQPFWTTAAMVILSVGSPMIALGALGTLRHTVILALVWYVCLNGARWVGKALQRFASVSVRITLFAAALVGSAIPPSLLLAAMYDFSLPAIHQSIAFVVQGPIVAWLVAAAFAIGAHATNVGERIAESDAKLSWLKARARLVRWHQHGQVARALHGPVQSELNAALMTMRRTQESGMDGAEAAHDFTATLQARIPVVLAGDVRERDVCRAVADAAQLWDGVTDIALTVDDDALNALNSDQAAADLAVSILQDAISNAVRHGRAANIWIVIDSRRGGEIHIDVNNDGLAPLAGARGGMGTAQLRECAIRWSATGDSLGYHLSATLPVGREPAG